jgi:chromosome segregation ATPase
MAEAPRSQSDNHANVDASALPKRRILLIEDDSRTRLVLWDKLRAAGFEVIHASNGVLGMEKMRNGPAPDAIFMDLLLPFVKGVEVIKEVRRQKEFATLPIFVCTSANNMTAWRRRGTRAGATKVFDKAATPIDAIIADVTATVLGRPAAPAQLKKKKESNQPSIQTSTIKKPAQKSSPSFFKSMKFSLKSLGFGKAKEGKSPPKPAKPPAEAEKPRITATQATVTAKAPTNPADQPLGALRPITPPTSQTSSTPRSTPQLPIQDPFADAGGGLPLNAFGLGAQALNSVAVLTLDSFGKIITADGASTMMFGWQSSELVGKKLELLLGDSAATVLGTLLQRAKPGETGQLASVRVSARRKNGSEFRASVTRLTWSSDTTMVSRFGGEHWTAVFRDLTSIPLSAQPPPPDNILPPGAGRSAGTPAPPAHEGMAFVNQLKAQMATSQPSQPLQQTQFHAPPPPPPESDELRKRFEAVSTEAAKNRELLEIVQRERQELTQRVSSQDADLARERTALEREITARKSLEEKFQELATKRGELEKQLSELTRGKDEALAGCAQLRGEVDAAKAAAERSRAASEKESERARQFEAEITRLQQAYNELNASFGKEQAKTAEFQQRADELEMQLRESTNEIEQIRGDLDRNVTERQAVEADWQQQFATLTAKCRHFENAWQEESQRNRDVDERVRLLGNSLRLEQTEQVTRLGEELSALRQGRYELDAKLAAEQQSASEAKRRADELDAKLRESASEIARVRSEQDAQAAERQRLETEWRNQLGTAETLARNLELALKEAADRSRRFEEEVSSLRQVRDNLNGRLAAEEKTVAESQARIAELDRQLRQNAAELDRAKAELAKADRAKQAEGQLASLYELRDRLSNQLSAEQQIATAAQQRTENLESELRANTLELNRLKVEHDRQAEEQARQQSELRAQLETAQSSARETDAALKRKAQECARFEKQIGRIEKARIDLETRLSTAQVSIRESGQRADALENELRDAAAELERIKAERDRQHASLERELNEKLTAALQAKEAVENSSRDQSEHNRELQRELAALREDRDALQVKLQTEKQLAAEAKRRDKEAEGRVLTLTGEVQRLKAEREKDARGRHAVETKLNEQVASAKTMLEQANAGLKERANLIGKLERDFANARAERDGLGTQLETEKRAVAEAKQRNNETEVRLRDAATEIERLKAELEANGRGRQSAENSLNEQLAAVKRAAERAENALKEKAEVVTGLEREKAELREARETLASELAGAIQSAAETKQSKHDLEVRVRELAAELERAKAERHVEAQGLAADLNGEIAQLREARETLANKLAAAIESANETKRGKDDLEVRVLELTTELERAKDEVQNASRGQDKLAANLTGELAAAKADAEESDAALSEKNKLIKRLERDTNNLRKERQDLCDKFAAEKEAGAKAKKRIKDLEKQLREIAAGFNTAKADLEKRTEGKGKAAAQLQAEIATAKKETEEATAAREEQSARYKELERQLAEATQTRQEASARLKTAETRVSESTQRIEQLEKRVRESAAELARAKAQSQAPQLVQIQSSDGALAEKSEELVKELARLRENEAAHGAEMIELERRVREGIGSLARATTDLENERSERRRVEQRLSTLSSQLEELHGDLREHLESEREGKARIGQLEQSLREREQILVRMNSELRKQTSERELAEEHLKSVGDMSAQLRQYLTLFEESKKVFKKAQDQLEARLQNSMANAKAADDRLQSEVSERARLEEALASAERKLQEQAEQAAVELVRAQAELQVEQLERTRVEGGAHHSRLASLDSTRVARTMMNSLRRQIRQPIESVMESSRRLLEHDLPQAQKKVVESLLENALLLQSTVEESESVPDTQGDLRKAA